MQGHEKCAAGCKTHRIMQVRCVFSCSDLLWISLTSLLTSDLCLSTCMQMIIVTGHMRCTCICPVLTSLELTTQQGKAVQRSSKNLA